MGNRGLVIAGGLLLAALLAFTAFEVLAPRSDTPAPREAPSASAPDLPSPRGGTVGTAPDAGAASAPLPASVDLSRADRERDLFGRVVARDGRPVPGARLVAVARPWRRSQLLTGRSGEETGPETLSATDGSFLLTLSPGRLVDLHATADGFAETILPRRQAGERVEVVLYPGATLTVSVLDPEGRPAPETPVAVWRPTTVPGPVVRRRAITGEDGRARFAGLTPGKVAVEVRHPRLAAPRWRDADVPAAGGAEITVRLEAGRTVRGRVVDGDTDRGIAGAEVGQGWRLDRAVRADAGGEFVFIGLSGRKVLEATAEGYGRGETVVPPGDEPVVIRLRRGDEVTGTVVDDRDRPVGGARVVAMASRHTNEGQRIDTRSGTAGPDGAFLLTSLRRDLPHTLLVEAEGHGKVRVDFAARAEGPGRIDLGTIALPPPRAIAGRVLDADGAPLAGVPVELRNVDPHHLDSFYGMEERTADDLGRFTFPDLSPGTYRVRAHVEGAPWMDAEVVLAADRERVEVELRRPAGGSLVVRAVDAAGEPLESVMVVPDRDDVRPIPSPTGADGRAKLTGLPAGPLTVRLHPQPSTGGPERSFRAAAREGVVANGQELTVALEETFPVRGVVLGPDGAALPRVFVKAYDGEEWRDQSRTDDEGRFVVRLQEGGSYRLVVDGTSRPGSFGGPVALLPLSGEVGGVASPSEGVVIRTAALPRDRDLVVRLLRPDGTPVAGATVTVGPDADFPRMPEDAPSGETGADGRVGFAGLTAQRHRVRVSGAAGAGLATPAPATVVPAGQEITLRYRAGVEFRGVVEDGEGRPVAGAEVHLFLMTGRELDRTKTDGSGRFALTGLPGERHQLYAGYVDAKGVERGAYVHDLPPDGKELRVVPE